jgi:protein-S-isoprenylcysteine O-methyltransferase Ste14
VFAVVAGIASLIVGLTLFSFTVINFAVKGRGTLAPWDPPRVLVVEGVYRYVRNPMISGVLFILFAESLFTGSPRVLFWFGLFLLMNLIYIPLFEERSLAARFGERYRIYKRNVPRWIPRITPWRPSWESDSEGS